MSEPIKQYAVSFQIYIHDKSTTYPEVKPIDLRINENLPANVDPHQYLRQRISEELKRAFSQQSIPIQNGEAPQEDPLA